MKRTNTLLCAVVLFSGLFVAPAGAERKLGVQITTVQDISQPGGTFEITGDASEFLCPSGTLEGTNTRIEWLTEDTFKIWQDKVLTCDDTAQVFVLELKNTIVLGPEGIPGKGTWKLKDSSGFDHPPKGKGEIVWGQSGETYLGSMSFK